MVTIKEAVSSAFQYLVDLLGLSQQTDVRIEEVESVGHEWRVTLSLPARGSSLSHLHQKREYKSLTIEKESGEVTSMKIRAIENA